MSYSLKDDYLDRFQVEFHKFIEKNSLPDKKEDKVLIKYFAHVYKIVEKPVSRIPSPKHYIWTRGHVKNYMTGKTAYIWILRVYKLKEPYWAESTPGDIRHANLNEEVSLQGMETVISDNKFVDVIRSIK